MLRRLLVVCMLVVPALADPLTFRQALELSVKNSAALGMAAAETEQAHQGYLEARDQYIPQLSVGSGLAYSNGFPLSLENAAPSVFNLSSQSTLFNLSQREFLRAAHTEWQASTQARQDRRANVLLEAALTYVQLDALTSSISVLQQQLESAGRAEEVVRQRVQAGVDSELELTRARLNAARVRMRLADARGTADVLRLRLSQFTGLPAQSIETVTESIPALPEVRQDQDMVQQAVEVNPAIKAALERAQAKAQRAQGEHKAFFPSVDLAAQYAVLSRFNNYDEFFQTFQRHNATLGVVIRFPFFNKPQEHAAAAADADALRAQREAETVKHQVSVQTLELQRSVQRLAAARDVARLDYQVTNAEVDATQARLDAGNANVRDLENARAAANEKYAALLDASFALDRAQMQLLRLVGKLDSWALGTPPQP